MSCVILGRLKSRTIYSEADLRRSAKGLVRFPNSSRIQKDLANARIGVAQVKEALHTHAASCEECQQAGVLV